MVYERKFDRCENLRELIFQGVGAASITYKTEAGNEVFNEAEARGIAEEICERIRSGIRDGDRMIGMYKKVE